MFDSQPATHSVDLDSWCTGAVKRYRTALV